MTRVPNTFYDPVTAETFSWPVNHLDQEGPAREENVEFAGKPGVLGTIGTQGSDQPLIITLTGVCLHLAQHVKFWEYRNKRNSFLFTDTLGNSYEVMMISYAPKDRRVAMNHTDMVNMPHKVVDYSMKLWILRVIAGELYTAGITA